MELIVGVFVASALIVDAPATNVSRGQSQDAPVVLEDIEVLSRRGSTAITPETEYGANAIDAFGAYDIGEVLRRAARATGGEDAPVVIINGQRVTNPSIYLSLPPDALERLEVLPPGSAGAFGGSTSGRVYNLVTQRQFKSRDIFGAVEGPTAGGFSQQRANLRHNRLSDGDLDNLALQVVSASPLGVGERPAYLAEHPDSDGATLRPGNTNMTATASFNRKLGSWSANVSANAQQGDSRSVSRVGDGMAVSKTHSRGVGVDGGASGRIADWALRVSLSTRFGDNTRRGLIEASGSNRFARLAFDTNRSLPGLSAGPIQFNAGADASISRSESDVGSGQGQQLSGNTRRFVSETTSWNTRLMIPLLKRAASSPRDGEEGPQFMGRLGEMSANLGAGGRTADAGGGGTLDAGLNWTPAGWFRVNAAWSRNLNTPSDVDRFGPIYLGETTVVHDFRTGQAVEVLPILGGNPDLRAETQDRTTLNLSVGPISPWRLSSSISVNQLESRDGLAGALSPTPENEAAYPERFIRDAQGQLTQIDQRPFNMTSSRSQDFTARANFETPMPWARDGRVQNPAVSLTYNRQLSNRMNLGPGSPVMDRLAGDGGGSPDQTASVQIGTGRGPWNLEMAGRWEAGYRLRRTSGVDGPEDVKVAALSKADLRLGYAFIGALPSGGQGVPIRQGAGTRLELAVDNLFDARPRARLASGRVAPSYGRDDRDPVGRLIRVSLTKRF